jgi:hypothetical protein
MFLIKFFLNGHKHGQAIGRGIARVHVRYYSARAVYSASRAFGHGHGRCLASVGFLIQLLTNQIIHAKITFPKDDQ